MANTHKRRRKMPAPLSDDPFHDDRGFDKRKLRQLCKQVEHAIGLALGDHSDLVLLDLRVEEVLPWPNSSRLLIVMVPTVAGATLDRSQVLARLDAAKGVLRSAVADAIHRKRTPELCFELFLAPEP